MRLSTLLQHDLLPPEVAEIDVAHLTLDSRQVTENSLFLAIHGANADGRDYIADAISRGVGVVLRESSDSDLSVSFQDATPLISIPQLPSELGPIAARFYQQPGQSLNVLGVTGTSGKTSTTHFMAQALHHLHQTCGLIGTLGAGVYGQLTETGLTTPDAITLQKTLHQLVEQGVKTVAMEVSSHSIAQHRVEGIPFKIGVFTNLSQDHLDYHGDMETYAGVKRHFLADMDTEQLILNMDDAYGKRWLNELAADKPIVAYGLRKSLSIPAHIPCIYPEQMECHHDGIHAKIVSPWGTSTMTLPLMGSFNLSNILAVLSALCLSDRPFEQVVQVLPLLKTVPGRMECIKGQNGPKVVIDYAHKPDALEKVLQALRSHTSGRLISVFGCGGERDKTKRSLMGMIAERLSDQVIITNDNPRHEDPEEIIADIRQGLSKSEAVWIDMDRAQAIQKAIQIAGPKDCVLIAGKGAERYQQVGDTKLPFDDLAVATQILKSCYGHIEAEDDHVSLVK